MMAGNIRSTGSKAIRPAVTYGLRGVFSKRIAREINTSLPVNRQKELFEAITLSAL
jgi:hypothetical protein